METDPGDKKKSEIIEMNDLVLPSYGNSYNTMFGGKLLEIVDKAAAICSMRFSGNLTVTASFEAVDFLVPIKVGQSIKITAKVVLTGHTSMMVKVEVWAIDPVLQTREYCLTAHVNMVAVDNYGKPITVPGLIVETDDEQYDRDEALIIRKATLARKQRRGNREKTG